MTGFPSSGKSTAAKKILQYFSEKGKEAVILTEGLLLKNLVAQLLNNLGISVCKYLHKCFVERCHLFFQ